MKATETPPRAGGDWGSAYHTPVLAREVLSFLGSARRVLDGTLGGGGHTLALLEHGAMVTALDRDPQAIAEARARLGSYLADGRFRAVTGNFADIEEISAIEAARFDGILLDLGVSSHQIDDPARGFSFREGAPLDMRMNPEGGVTGAELLNGASEHDLIRIFREYADEPRASRLAREIGRRRVAVPFSTSDDLVKAIRGALGARSGPSDFARLFQAVRIEVNDELASLDRALPVLRERLEPGGVMVVIAYHSGEDRTVKHAFRDWSASCVCPPRQPQCTCRGYALGETLTRRSVTASDHENASNPRARSARLRAWRRAR
ncbi:MAG: 16S rRNA (cytosine(1402)-N(4))-methyltransferase RsmH [Gemmatimonadota bacterium]|nr:16S rRNA (cytosine(1402)-N(4))-methyltransferase RsmH [Gemmatimonadota bacterium]